MTVNNSERIDGRFTIERIEVHGRTGVWVIEPSFDACQPGSRAVFDLYDPQGNLRPPGADSIDDVIDTISMLENAGD